MSVIRSLVHEVYALPPKIPGTVKAIPGKAKACLHAVKQSVNSWTGEEKLKMIAVVATGVLALGLAASIRYVNPYGYGEKVAEVFKNPDAQKMLSVPVVYVAHRILYPLFGNRKKEIAKAIEDSHLEADKKEGVALYLRASAGSDHNFALVEGDHMARDIQALAKKFIVQSKVVPSSEEAARTIEEACKERSVKVVVISAHGAGGSFNLGNEIVRGDNPRLIEALKKTDANAHILLSCCSTGKLRDASGIYAADTLSLALEGRTVTAPAEDAGVSLLANPSAPQGISLLCKLWKRKDWKSHEIDKIVTTHSFCVKGQERQVTISYPWFYLLKQQAEGKDGKEMPEKKRIEVDAQYATPGLNNKYLAGLLVT